MQYIMHNIRYLYIFYAVAFFFLLVKLNAFILMFHAKHFDIFTLKNAKSYPHFIDINGGKVYKKPKYFTPNTHFSILF